jgi:hypothetical protein
MKQLLSALLFTLPLLLATSCGSKAEAATPIAITHSTHDVMCGCSLEEIGHCGNYIEIDGEEYPISAEEGEGKTLGGMEWCGVDGATAEVEGEIKDGEFIATYIKKIQP